MTRSSRVASETAQILSLFVLSLRVWTIGAGDSSPLDKIFASQRLQGKNVTIRLDEYLQQRSDANIAPLFPAKGVGGQGSFEYRLENRSAQLYIYENSIPRIIHQMWKTTKIQRTFAPYIRSWIRLHPFWEYRFWTDASGEEFIRRVYPEFWPLFEGFNGIQRSDALRYFILYNYGGIYADLDVESVAPLDEILDQPLILSQEPLAHAVVLEDRPRQVCNAFMASRPGHPFWPFVHNYMASHQVRRDPVGSTGPRMLDAALEAYINTSNPETVFVGSPERFMPLFDDKLNNFRRKCERWSLSDRQLEYCKVMRERDFVNQIEDDTLTVHHWSHTWLGHVTDDHFVDVWEVVNSTRNRYLANTFYGASEREPHDQHMENPWYMILTSEGNITIELFVDQMPYTASNFINLANTHFYDGLQFHRVIPNFMIQFGDASTRSFERFEDTRLGGSKFVNLATQKIEKRSKEGYIRDEFKAGLSNEKYTISMANTGQPNSGGYPKK
ncbi:hypothetical protein AAMO2058_001484100 [Amorphochlora amoebiformis]